MNSYDTHTMTPHRVYLAESDIQEQFQKLHNLYKIKSTTSTRSHANKNKHKKDNWFREHFGQNLSSQNTRNGVSEHQDFMDFWQFFSKLFGIPVSNFPAFYEHNRERPSEHGVILWSSFLTDFSKVPTTILLWKFQISRIQNEQLNRI